MTTTTERYDYRIASACLKWILDDMRVLAGDDVGPSGQSWQDVARNLAANMRDYASQLEAAANGRGRKGFGAQFAFPSPSELMDR